MVTILTILVGLIAYAQLVTQEKLTERVGSQDWKAIVQQQINDYESRQNSVYATDERKQMYRARVEQFRYYLEHDINPSAPGNATFTRIFMDVSSSLLLPLLVVTLSADIVSMEWVGTIKLLLTRPVARWKILLSKYITLVMFISLMVLVAGVLSALLGGFFFGWTGWGVPTVTGFVIKAGALDTSQAYNVPQWFYILQSYGLAWVGAVAVGTITFTVSVLVRSTAATMGIMLAAIIGGNILQQLASSWTSIKYFFAVNLGITGYLSGMTPPIEGLSLPFAIGVLAIWSIIALMIGFTVFVKRDVLA